MIDALISKIKKDIKKNDLELQKNFKLFIKKNKKVYKTIDRQSLLNALFLIKEREIYLSLNDSLNNILQFIYRNGKY
jgi:hypothetical protein